MSNVGGAVHDSNRVSGWSLIDKIELSKARGDSSALLHADGSGNASLIAELQKLRGAMKKLEEQREFLAIEKDQLECELQIKSTETEDLKSKLRISTKTVQGVQAAYSDSLKQLSSLNAKLSLMASNLAPPDSFESLRSRLEGLVQENEKVERVDPSFAETSNP